MKSYGYNGVEWEVLPGNSIAGTSLIWKGSLAEAPENPVELWAYYNTADGKSYIYSDETWQILASPGTSGLNGETSDIVTVENFSAYYTALTNGKTYTITLQGELTEAKLKDVATVIKNNSSKSINLDLTCVTGLETIPENCFSSSLIKSIALPSSIKVIQLSAFYSSKIEKMRLNNGLQHIQKKAFEQSNLTSVDIPASVKMIDDNAFYTIKSLTDINLREGLQSIGNSAFGYTGLTSIGKYAFENSGLSSINLTNSILSIGEGAFEGTKLSSVVIPEDVVKISSNAFGGCTALKTVVIPSTVESMGDYIFRAYNSSPYNCESLTDIYVCGYSETPFTWSSNWTKANYTDYSDIITWNYVRP